MLFFVEYLLFEIISLFLIFLKFQYGNNFATSPEQ